jgi:cysteinyl-tRNA synthetase
MSERYLGTPFDIHAGGEDLVFPHHENELAQSGACNQGSFANYWLHGGMLTIDKEKMSKSVGNFLLLRDVLVHVRPQALRLLMLQTHYRSPFDYSPERLEEATAALERVEGALRNIQWALDNSPFTKHDSSLDQAGAELADARSRFEAYMDDDFNTAGAVSVVFELVTEANRILSEATEGLEPTSAALLREIHDTILELLGVFGIELEASSGASGLIEAGDLLELLALAKDLAAYNGSNSDEALVSLLAARTEAREAKDWSRADAVRNGLTRLGFAIEDTPQGPRISRA